MDENWDFWLFLNTQIVSSIVMGGRARMDFAEFWSDMRGQESLDLTNESVVRPKNFEDVNLENNYPSVHNPF